MAKRWKVRTFDAARASQLERTAAVPPVVAQLLINRGVEDPQVVKTFVAARLSELRDPSLLPGLNAAADRIHAAIVAGEPIVVYGDYDADGMTSTAILMRCMRLLSAEASYYIPHRIEEGYGLNHQALEKLAAGGAKVVVTVDCGITSVDEAETAKRLGIDLIITDHHEMADRLPDATAIVHPRLPGHDYPFDGLCGAAVAFKLAWALCQRACEAKRVGPRFQQYLLSAMGLAAIGTVADVVPLLDENRLIVRHGLTSLKEYATAGMAALMAVTKTNQKPQLTADDIAFMLAPRLNAAGRMGQADLAVELMTTDDDARARGLAEYLDELNVNRRSVELGIYRAAQKQVEQQFDVDKDAALVLAGRGWHAGVIGIVAGRIAEKYGRPCVMIALDELGQATGTGSARSASGLNLHKALTDCSDDLLAYGGHAAAAGLRIDEKHVDAFRAKFVERVANEIAPEDRVVEVIIDAETPLAQLTLKTVKQIETLAPFGQSNPRPVLCATGVAVAGNVKKIGGGNRHLSFSVKHHDVTFRAIAFGQADWAEDLDEAKENQTAIDIAFHPVLNEFNGRRSVELQIIDWRPHVSHDPHSNPSDPAPGTIGPVDVSDLPF